MVQMLNWHGSARQWATMTAMIFPGASVFMIAHRTRRIRMTDACAHAQNKKVGFCLVKA
jgi:hypothetical protein